MITAGVAVGGTPFKGEFQVLYKFICIPIGRFRLTALKFSKHENLKPKTWLQADPFSNIFLVLTDDN